MSQRKQCLDPAPHADHEWSIVVPIGWFKEKVQREYYYCEGVIGVREQDREGVTEQLEVVQYRDLQAVSFDLMTREGIPSRFEFKDLLPGDAEASLTVMAHKDIKDGWAVVEIRLLARQPFKVTEIEETGE